MLILLAPHAWCIPAVAAATVGLLRPPRTAVVGDHRRGVAEDRIDDPPGLLDRRLAREQVVLALERRGQEPLVGRHLVRRLAHRQRLDVLHLELLRVGAPRLDFDADRHVGVDLEAQPVAVRVLLREQTLGRALELDHDLGRLDGQALAGAHEDRDVGPAPGVDVETQRRVCLDGAVRVHALRLAVAAVLAADHIPRR